MCLTASSASSGVSAATQATTSPKKRVLSSARMYWSCMISPITFMPGISLAVTTQATPSIASASEVSMETMRACGYAA